jgi:hypothetical protein
LRHPARHIQCAEGSTRWVRYLHVSEEVEEGIGLTPWSGEDHPVGGGKEGFTGRAAIGYDHGYDGEVFYLGLALDPHYVDGWVEGCLERIGEDYPEEELLFRDLWEDDTQREVVIESLKADCEVRTGRPAGL